MNVIIGTGTLTNTLANIDSAAVPTDNYRMVKAITLCNKTADDVWVTIQLHNINVLYRYVVPGYGDREENTITIPFMDQVMTAGQRITGRAEVSSAIDYYISGFEAEVS